jgi:hypothetical protein
MGVVGVVGGVVVGGVVGGFVVFGGVVGCGIDIVGIGIIGEGDMLMPPGRIIMRWAWTAGGKAICAKEMSTIAANNDLKRMDMVLLQKRIDEPPGSAFRRVSSPRDRIALDIAYQ